VLKNLTLFATTRCDLKCAHCLRGYPTSHDDFPLDLLPNLLDEARLFGAQHVGLTGGEPRLHTQFERLTNIILEADYKLSFVSNGQDVKPYLAVFKRCPEQVTSVALSLDDADPAGHDRNRGKPGAFDEMMASASILVSTGCRVYLKARAHSR
jgi:MoaA/NifB/PqqE/SkfB family radical SAM enzyme